MSTEGAPPHPRSMDDVLAGAGDVGRDLLSVDWTATPVGPPGTWSLSLRTAARILLTSKFSMWMAWGPELTFFCNDAYRRDTLGTKYPWALGRPASEVWSEIWDDIGPRIHRVLSDGEATWDESLLLFLERSGYVEETYHTFSYSPLADDDGTVTGMLCVVTEVTDQVIADRRMRTLRDLGVGVRTARNDVEAVAQACAHLASNPMSIPFAGVYLFDEPSAGRMATRAGTSGIGTDHPAMPLVLHDDTVWPVSEAWRGSSVDVDRLDRRFPDLPTGAWDRPAHQGLVVPVLRPGDEHPYGFLAVGANPYCLIDDAYRGFVDLVAAHLAGAITDARAIDGERRRAERLAALDQAKSDFLANVSHELRTPLTLLLGPAEDAVLDEERPLDPVQQGRLDLVVRNGRRMLQLVNALLDYSRLESGEGDATFVPTDLGRLTAELASLFESAAVRAGLTLEVRVEPVPVHVDHDHWSKIVVNLLSNAFKFTFEGGVVVVVDEHEGRARLRVSDTGEGIDAQELPHLFDRFHRVRGARSRSHEGSGIGLALVDQLVRAHGGEVSVTSTPGRGTEFVVTLPLGTDHLPAGSLVEAPLDLAEARLRYERRVATDTASWTTEHLAVSSPAGPTGTLARVLVVDDNADMRAYTSGLLQEAGYDVTTAADGLEALEHLAGGGVDLVLTDVMMPRLDGFGLLAAVRADPATTALPVVMISARAGEEGTLEGLGAGADDYLVKPFSSRELLARVRTNVALDRAAQVQALLQRGKELLDQAQRLAAVGSWEVDLEQDTIIASDTFLELLDLTSEQLVGLGASGVMSSLVHPDDLERVTDLLAAAARGDDIAYETRVVLPSGRERLFAARGERVPAAVPGRAPSVVRGSFQDITEQRATQERLIAAEAAHEAAEREREIADALQRALLPVREIDVEVLDVATYYRAGAEGARVGGDWYDVIDLGAGRVVLVIGDVMGSGVRAAAATGQLRSAVRALVRLDLGPAAVLEQLDGIVADLADQQIVTCAIAVVDATAMTLDHASAGHPPVVVTHAETSTLLPAGGPPLGAGFFGAASTVVPLAPGDVVALYTDGLVEQRGSDLLDDIDRLADRLRSVRDAPVTEQVDAVLAARAARGMVVDDDIALLVARLRPPDADRTLRLPLAHAETAPARARAQTEAHLARVGVADRVRADVVLAVSELVTNAVLHASPPLSLRVSVSDKEVLVEVTDRTLRRPQRRRPGDEDEYGRGMHIVGAVATAWGTRRLGVGKAVWCSFAL